MADIFVLIDGYVALASLDDEGNDFIGKAAGLLPGFRLVLRGERKLVLLFAGQFELAGNVYSSDAHVITMESIG